MQRSTWSTARGSTPPTADLRPAKEPSRPCRQLTGVPINYLITVNFRAFKQVVDKVGGVYVDVDRRYFNDNSSGYDNYATINLQPGYQKLNGGRALDFVRYRHTDSDFYRIRRQQLFVTAFKQRVSGLFSLTKLPGIIKAITENVEIARGGSKEIDADTLLSYARFAYGLPSGNFDQVTIDPSQLSGATEVQAPQSAVDDAVRQFLNPDPHAARKATDVATNRKPKQPDAPPPARRRSPSGTGTASTARPAMRRICSVSVSTGRDRRRQHADLRLLPHHRALRPPAARAREAAAVVARLFGDAHVARAKPVDKLETMLKVVVGQTFKGTLGPGVIDKTPKYQPPQVVEPAQMLPLARQAQKQVNFKFYVPTVRGSSVPGPDGSDADLRSREARRLAVRLRHGRHERLLGHGGDALDGGADPRGAERDAADRGPRVPTLLQRLEAPHGRLRVERRRVLGRQHPARQAVERDDAGGREGFAAAVLR